ncbi:hypothetical protein [Terrilactibacillus laevilacticus]|uniref:hypothetical protein n=1 Tax=Terrilactibacillus laevilacticus TaxID=1380157 RepID=UPI0011478ED4|nr:hypothetical protein [Terrilactibacillus laevilacticus]
MLLTIPLSGCVFEPTNSSKKYDDFSLLFNINEKANQQGLTYNKGIYYVGFDVGNGQGIIVAYNKKGKLIGSTKRLDLGHNAELDYYNNKIYVANGGIEPAKIFIVDFKKSTIVKTINAETYGYGALVAVKNKDIIILHTTVNNGKRDHIFSFLTLNGHLIKQFKINNIGMPQGMDYSNGKIYLYTNNKISIINESGELLNQKSIRNIHGESEGITLAGNKIAIGYNQNNRIYTTKLIPSNQ